MYNPSFDEWLQFVPRPEPLPAGKHFHVFIQLSFSQPPMGVTTL
ncbi:hypothetical protein C8R30_106117 [Nitrosomonas nitrosa]|jgi:hypothetical protein|uniref:Uncharacterized protein n=1 Tax=Nitrosomonas nitrosa TaxID=52442 RepID=A0A1I4T8F9_9PROT|nr:hypothetical protein C8R30_106117 [Nitrosomonas nitrosa]SFM72857.1 hypothetical protein SAMN05421880_1305 [Nitrosomonas nitrosa]